MDSYVLYGADGLWISHINSIGCLNGFSNLAATGNSGMRHVKGVQNVPSELGAPVKKYIRGDNRVYNSKSYASDTLPSGVIEVGTLSQALNAAMQGSTVWTLGNWEIGVLGTANPTFPTMCALVHVDANGQDDGDTRSGFENRLYGNCQLMPMGGDNPTYQGEGKNRMNITLNPMTRSPLGVDLSASNVSVEDGLCLTWWSLYRTMFHAVIGDGAATSFVVDHVPVDADSTKVYKMKLDQSTPEAATAVTVASVTTATKTISVAPTVLSASYIYVCMYEASSIV